MRISMTIAGFACLFLIACQKQKVNTNQSAGCSTELTRENIYDKENKRYLWAGEDSSTHFNITDWALNECQLYDYGYQRETISALIEPEYKPINEVANDYQDNEKIIYVQGNGFVKVYPYILMRFHEVINEYVDGEPVMIAYCYLADLAAVYTRVYCDKEFTFAVSGYTYADENVWNGLQAFVLWDRETESLWWPLIDAGVSGAMKGELLKKHNEDRWGYSTWGEAKTIFPEALVLQINQNWQPPINLPHYTCEDLPCCN
ncbi:MAG: hypothetical protein DHS20C18_11880 [Saprospiraceae bacterium]|nr:MAG: hypothetical protein DHS20C18_11880 [Saprospiraceae bacterium]